EAYAGEVAVAEVREDVRAHRDDGVADADLGLVAAAAGRSLRDVVDVERRRAGRRRDGEPLGRGGDVDDAAEPALARGVEEHPGVADEVAARGVEAGQAEDRAGVVALVPDAAREVDLLHLE